MAEKRSSESENERLLWREQALRFHHPGAIIDPFTQRGGAHCLIKTRIIPAIAGPTASLASITIRDRLIHDASHSNIIP